MKKIGLVPMDIAAPLTIVILAIIIAFLAVATSHAAGNKVLLDGKPVKELDLQTQRQLFLSMMVTGSLEDNEKGQIYADLRKKCPDLIMSETLKYDSRILYGKHCSKGINYYFLGIRGTIKTDESWTNNYLLYPKESSVGWIHAGFRRVVVEAVLPDKHVQEIAKAVKEDPKARLIVAGMSQGGAEACLLAAYLCKDYGLDKSKMTVRLFGNPSSGLKDFNDRWKDKLDVINVIRENDMIPNSVNIVNNKVFQYSHTGRILYIQEDFRILIIGKIIIM